MISLARLYQLATQRSCFALMIISGQQAWFASGDW